MRLDPPLLAEAKKLAVEQGTTLTAVIIKAYRPIGQHNPLGAKNKCPPGENTKADARDGR